MKFTAPFYGVRSGEIYPVHFAPGEDCPPELQEAARLTGAINAQNSKAAKAEPVAEVVAPAAKPTKAKK